MIVFLLIYSTHLQSFHVKAILESLALRRSWCYHYTSLPDDEIDGDVLSDYKDIYHLWLLDLLLVFHNATDYRSLSRAFVSINAPQRIDCIDAMQL